VDAHPASCFDLVLVCRGTWCSRCRQRPLGPPRERLRTRRWTQFFGTPLSYLKLFTQQLMSDPREVSELEVRERTPSTLRNTLTTDPLGVLPACPTVTTTEVWSAKCRSDFTTLPPVLLQEQPTMVLLLERALVSWSLAMDERGGHEDLCGSDRQSVIPYVHRRTELYCSSLSCLSLLFLSTPVKRRLPEPFIAQGRAVTLRPGAR
jgi:hypothetical protein